MMKPGRKPRLLALFCVVAALGACSQREEGVYGEPIPDPADKAAIQRIAEQLPAGEDRAMWAFITVRLNAAEELGVDSDSVREAIEREKVRSACTAKYSATGFDVATRDKLSECTSQPI